MKIILIKNIDNLGFKYELKNVKPGYAMNYLIPKKIAILATPSVIKHNQEIIKQKEKKEQYKQKIAKDTVKKLNNITLKIKAKKDQNGHLYGSIDNKTIEKELSQIGIHLDKKSKIIPMNKINNIGKYIALIILHNNIETLLNIEII